MTRTPPSPGRSRQSLGISIAVGLGILVVGAVLLVTLFSGKSGDDPQGSGTTVAQAPATTLDLPPELLAPAEIPDGDYDAFCTELLAQTDSFSTQTGMEQLRTLFDVVRFEKLVPLAPEGLRPALQTLADNQDEARLAFEQIDDPSQMEAADFPEGFLTAFSTVGRAVGTKCTTPTKTTAD